MHQGLWSPDHPVLRVLRERIDGQDHNNSNNGDYKVGLAVEGGGMRGIVSAAMLCAIEDTGFRRAFDIVYSNSAGALNSAVFITGSAWKSVALYCDGRLDRRFIDWRRTLQGRPMMDIRYLFEDVLEGEYSIDYEELLAGPRKLAVDVTFVDEGVPELINLFDSPSDMRNALMASCWRPLEAGGATNFRGRPAVDGSVLRPFPYVAAVADGCTHVLSLSTTPTHRVRARPSLLQRAAGARLETLRGGLRKSYFAAINQKARDHQWLIQQRFITDQLTTPSVLDFSPPMDVPRISNSETDVARLMKAARTAYAMMHSAMTGGLHSSQPHAWPRVAARLFCV
jgi:predicted patatin/cPLA2 family phospholipase